MEKVTVLTMKKNDNYKEQGCRNEEQKSRSPEQRKILTLTCICTQGAVVFS